MKHIQPDNKISAQDVFNRILEKEDEAEIKAAVTDKLMAQFGRSKRYQENRGVTFTLTFDELLSKITPSRWKRMENKMRSGEYDDFMRSTYGYVITWKNREALNSKNMNAETVAFLNREDSKLNSRFIKGDKHSDKAKAAIGNARRGKKMSDETKGKIRAKKVGVKQDAEVVAARAAKLKDKPKSGEHKARMAEAARQRWAKVREAKAALGTSEHK
ncbi:hypothetical protein ACUTJJ_05200 [Agrobacterium sp. DKPNP3]|uniref:hypothetical protein n=1 Tax=Agrobacterium sp. DKPNP3 TaxID=3457323 RepID=UPI0040451976